MKTISVYHPDRGDWDMPVEDDSDEKVAAIVERYAPPGTERLPERSDAGSKWDAKTKNWVAVPPPPAKDTDVRMECQRRLIAAFHARDATHLERLINEATMEAVDLLSRQDEWTEADQTRVAELKADRALVAAHDAASKALRAMTPIPADYTDDKHWPPPSP